VLDTRHGAAESSIVRPIAIACVLLLGYSAAAAQQPPGERLSPFQRAKAEALLETKLPCLGCHTIGAQGGYIGPDLSDVGTRLDRARLRAQIEAPAGLMPRIPMPPSTLELLVAYLAEQRGEAAPAARARPMPPAAAAAGSRAEQLYQRHCAACHGGSGRGDGWNAQYLDRPPARHADARAMGARTDDRLFDGIHAGGAAMGGSARMPPFGATLTAEEIRLLVGHIRRLCRCRQPAWAGDAR
jgi:cytochrome c oxidase cbb3-type subunit III